MHRVNIRIVVAIAASLMILASRLPAQQQPDNAKTGMLILGSDNLQTLKARVEAGYNLYTSGVVFDYIIVSGGCAAHGSEICEATEMAQILADKGVPASKIFKEERSKSTVQNYCYSRMLEDDNGMSVINPQDRLYVVSNHWHAIPVAARFTTYDSVRASYHIEGAILPRSTDKVDYTNIYNSNYGPDDYCKSALWPSVSAVHSLNNRQVDQNSGSLLAFYHDYVLRIGLDEESQDTVVIAAEWFPDMPAMWQGDIDASFYNELENRVYLFKGPRYMRLKPDSKRPGKNSQALISDWVKNLPDKWQAGGIDAAVFIPDAKKIMLFKGEEYVEISAGKREMNNQFPRKIRSLVSNWPFEWGSGAIDAATYDRTTKELVLYRGKQYLRISSGVDKKVLDGYPKKIVVNATDPF